MGPRKADDKMVRLGQIEYNSMRVRSRSSSDADEAVVRRIPDLDTWQTEIENARLGERSELSSLMDDGWPTQAFLLEWGSFELSCLRALGSQALSAILTDAHYHVRLLSSRRIHIWR